MRPRPVALAALVVAAALAAGPAEAATTFDGETKLVSGGTAVAVSADGSIAVVGDAMVGFPGGLSHHVGAIQILARSATGWKASAPIYQQLISQNTGNGLGASVAISPDGSTVVAGAPHPAISNQTPDRAEVFTVTVGADGVPQATRVAVLAGSPAFGTQTSFGSSVAVTRLPGPTPHTIVAVGAPNGTPYIDEAIAYGAGKVHVFVDPVSPQYATGLGDIYGTEIYDPGALNSTYARLGAAVAISSDASTIVAGAPAQGPQFHAGAVAVFTGAGTAYTFSRRFTGQTAGGNLGASVALAADASTVMAGEPMTDVSPAVHGAARTFCLAACALPATIVPRDGGHAGDAFGTSVALSADGRTALVGAPYAGYRGQPLRGSAAVPGSAYIEDAVDAGGAPAEQVLVPRTTADQGGAGSYFGHSVALSADGLEALAGAPVDMLGHAADFTVGWAFAWTRPAPVIAPPAPTPVATPEAAPAPAPAPAAGGSAASRLAVGCSNRRLSLLNVVTRKGRVALLGAADASLIGRTVAIRYAGRTKVATAVVGSDGFFSATAPLPPKADRGTNRARYVALAGTQRSLDLKLTRRLIMQPPTATAGKVTLRGTVVTPLATPVAQIVVTQQLSCRAKATIVARVRPGRGGAFRITIAAPKGAKAALYRLATAVRKTARNPKRFPTFSLPQAVNLAG